MSSASLDGLDGSKVDYEAKIASPSSPEIEYIDPVAEKKVLRKLDIYLQPVLGMIYCLCFLDRGNIGNAMTAGMQKALGLTAQEKAASISLIYATYVIFECVWPLFIKLLTPRWTMSIAMLAFGAITLGTAWVTNYSGLVICRLLLGISEAGVFPCIVVYYSMIYKREELGQRLSYIFVFAALSGAFGGLIAFGLSHITTGSIAAWSWIYIVEGILTLAFVPFVFFWIPSAANTAWFLNKAEKDLCTQRYESNKREYSDSDKLELRYVLAAWTDPTTYLHGAAQFGIDIGLYGISTFMPIFINAFGYSTVTSQILTVPVYFVGATSFVIQAHYSDKYKKRGVFILANMTLVLVGYIILCAVGSPSGVRYAALYIVALGVYAPVGLNVGWTQANHAPHYKRAAAVGLMQLVGNSSGAAIGFIYIDSPRYIQGFGIAIGLQVVAMSCIALLMIWYNRLNVKKRAAIAAGAPDQPELGDKNPHYIYML